jgi:hypothetical protein
MNRMLSTLIRQRKHEFNNPDAVRDEVVTRSVVIWLTCIGLAVWYGIKRVQRPAN